MHWRAFGGSRADVVYTIEGSELAPFEAHYDGLLHAVVWHLWLCDTAG